MIAPWGEAILGIFFLLPLSLSSSRSYPGIVPFESLVSKTEGCPLPAAIYFLPTWIATIPPVSRLYETSEKPASCIQDESPFGSGKSATEAGRYE